ncbi:hypothetical protein V1511DRAFT_460756 [Dipodascopsis uninucleata]
MSSGTGPLTPITSSHVNSSPSRPASRAFKDITDISALKSSSVNHLRNLASTADDLNIPGVTEDAQDVAGLQGRIRLQKTREAQSSSSASRNWMDKQRKALQAYEYLCHIGEAKEWIEACIGETIPPVIELEEALRDGVILAQLSQVFAPGLVKKIFRAPKLQWLHSNNIHIFFNFLDEVSMPDLFRFEFTDLYDKKNIPKVIYCIHALGFILSSQGLAPEIGDLVGKLHFTDDEIRNTQRGLDAAGISLPNFKAVTLHFDDSTIPMRPPTPDDEKIDRMLISSMNSIILFQSRCRGALIRSGLYGFLDEMEQVEPLILKLQSLSRAKRVRNTTDALLEQRGIELFAINMQTMCRSLMARYRILHKINALTEYEPTAIQLQAYIRSMLARNQLQGQTEQLSLHTRQLVEFQSLIRTYLYKKCLLNKKTEIGNLKGFATALQSQARGYLARRRIDHILSSLLSAPVINPLSVLQARARGNASRNKMVDHLQLLHGFDNEAIRDLQSRIRGYTSRKKIESLLVKVQVPDDRLIDFQALCRGAAVRLRILSNIELLQSSMGSIVALQTEMRGALGRQLFNELHEDLARESHDFSALQSHMRGVMSRFKFYTNLRTIDEAEEIIIVPLQSQIRGFFARSRYFTILRRLTKRIVEVVELQSLIRGAMVRVEYRGLLMDVDEEVDILVELQANIRGFFVRRRMSNIKKCLENNINMIIRLQSLIRAKQQSEAYKSLTSGKNPSLATVKNFIHLLTDSDLDFEEEVEFENLRKRVVDEVHKNEQLEQYINQLDVKIALLVKNKITLDEVIKHQRGSIPRYGLLEKGDPFDLKSLNVTSRRRLELYQGIFFILQTQSAYLARLFSGLRDGKLTEMDLKSIEGSIMSLFGYAQKRREEFFLLKLVAESINITVAETDAMTDIVRGNHMWSRIMAAYTKGAKEKEYIYEIIGVLVKSIVSEEELDLESDPLTIYHTSINNEELRTGRRSTRDHNVVVDVAIKDPETRATYIRNLQSLREFVVQFLNVFEQNVDSIPYGIRYIGRELFRALQTIFSSETEERILSVVGNFIYHRYMNVALIAPDMYALNTSPLHQVQKKNLNEVSKIILQMCSGKLFTEENVFLQPLNANLKSYIMRMRSIVRQVIQVSDPEVYFDMDEFDDLTSTQRPTLYIKTSDIYSIHSIILKFMEYIIPDPADPLRTALKDLGPLPSNAGEILNVTRIKEAKLDLNPSFISVEDPEGDVRSVIVEAKRCLLYIIRVQPGHSLLDILVRQVTDDDEEKYVQLLKEEEQSKVNNSQTYMTTSLEDLHQLSYRDLKVIALEKIIELENLGRVTRKNNYQELLNSIATDIRTKRNRRVRRRKELESIHQTLGHLAEKEHYLQTQLQSYNDYIEQAMSTLQAKKGRRRAILPFTKQYFHVRELQKSGRMPKFGSFKYSASKLFEKGVLLELLGFSDRQYDKVNFTISSDQIGVFFIEASQGSITLPGGSLELPLDELLDKQFNNQQTIKLFDDMAVFNTNLLLHLIFKKFYRDD